MASMVFSTRGKLSQMNPFIITSFSSSHLKIPCKAQTLGGGFTYTVTGCHTITSIWFAGNESKIDLLVQSGGRLPHLLNLEACVLHDVPDDWHDLGRELPLLLLQSRTGGLRVRSPVGNEDVVGGNIGEQGQPQSLRGVHDLLTGEQTDWTELHMLQLDSGQPFPVLSQPSGGVTLGYNTHLRSHITSRILKDLISECTVDRILTGVNTNKR